MRSFQGQQPPGPMRGGLGPSGPSVPTGQQFTGPRGPANARPGAPVPPPPNQPGPAPRFVRKPTDKNINPKVQAIIPESKLYSNLLEAEKSLDAVISRKKLDLQDSLSGNMKRTCILRLCISNTATDQPWQLMDREIPEENLFDFDTGMNPSWCLRIEGKLLNGDGKLIEDTEESPRPKLSSLLQSLVIELDRSEELYPDSNVIEWHQSKKSSMPPEAQEWDAIEVRRKGDENVNARILIQLNEFPDYFKFSDELSKVIPVQCATKPAVVMHIWQYIKYRKLQDPSDKRTVICDDALRQLFGQDHIQFPQIIELLTNHLKPLEPIEIFYTINVEKAAHHAENYYDIKIEVDDPMRKEMTKTLESCYDIAPELAALDEHVCFGIQELNALKSKREFFTMLYSDPASFIKTWTASQSHDMDVLLADRTLNNELIRRADMFKDPEILRESIQLLLNR
ncbi:hypothetical protein CANCADRAFT_103840 [Tortispora caseinolytica NRRL Y-17796]|uniref:DM2 domain-containing protein n=1 Tax=Tortispora caseinolytica NRRL Y-17796 TaxID=767744 RepID=A0A1E4TEW5_9ASCO|nr:hypothetical protein CANCADRAFT_103840 [Tortispora caseinolytica NRRL Y-17796]